MSEALPNAGDADVPGEFVLTDEHRMLLDIRDTLYEGSWEDFKRDLEARRRSQPHVFDTVPDSPQMLQTIREHLLLIGEMWNWEKTHGTTLRSGRNAG